MSLPTEEKEPIILDKIEEEHISILKQLALPCTSNRHRFTNRERLNKIHDILKDSSYKTKHLALSDIYFHQNLNTQNIILITAHCDTIPDKPFVSYNNETDELKGTFDNLISNAVLTILMKENEIPSNVVFAFTGDEETGKCMGCKDTVAYLKKRKYCIKQAIALDVTWEGYNNYTFSFENFGEENKKHESTQLFKAFQSITKDCTDSTNIPRGMYDEGYALRDAGIKEHGSFCIPTKGPMHTNEGLYCHRKTFEGYLLSLSSLLFELTHTHPELIEEYKMMREKYKPIMPVHVPSFYSYSSEYSSEELYQSYLNLDNTIQAYEDMGYELSDEESEWLHDIYSETPFIPLTDWESWDYLSDNTYEYDTVEDFVNAMTSDLILQQFYQNQGITTKEEVEENLRTFYQDCRCDEQER